MGVIRCVDALEGLRQLESHSVDLIITDPPYPISRNNSTGRLLNGHKQEKEWFIEAYDDWEDYFNNCVVEMMRILKLGRHIYIFANESNLVPMKLLLDNYLTFKSILIWHKGSKAGEAYGMGYHYRKSCEYILLYSNGKSDRFITDCGTLLQYSRNRYKVNHPTPKPVDMLRLFIEKSSFKGEIVLDPFIGSGSTAIACKQINRDWIGFDIDSMYVNMAKKRLEQSNLIGLGGG